MPCCCRRGRSAPPGARWIVVLGYNAINGFREDATAVDVIVNSIEAMGLAMVVSLAALILLGRIDAGTSLRDAVGQIALESIPVAFGASLARAQLGGGDEASEGGGQQRFGPFERLLVAGGGALLFSLNIAPTEEPMLIGIEASPGMLVALIAASLLVTLALVFVAEFGGRGHKGEGSSATVVRDGRGLRSEPGRGLGPPVVVRPHRRSGSQRDRRDDRRARGGGLARRRGRPHPGRGWQRAGGRLMRRRDASSGRCSDQRACHRGRHAGPHRRGARRGIAGRPSRRDPRGERPPGDAGWIIPLTITNDGDQSVESVVLEATATVDGQEETSEIELPFLPARTELQAEVAFSARPDEPITVRLVGFRLP